MESCPPPVTCPNWRCYSTGKNPGKLGVFWWEKIDTEERTLTTPTSRSFKSSNYWDYLNDAGKTVGIMNLPMSYPPFEVDGWMVAGGPAASRKTTRIRVRSKMNLRRVTIGFIPKFRLHRTKTMRLRPPSWT